MARNDKKRAGTSAGNSSPSASKRITVVVPQSADGSQSNQHHEHQARNDTRGSNGLPTPQGLFHPSYDSEHFRQRDNRIKEINLALKDFSYSSPALSEVVSAEINTTFTKLLNHVFIVTSMARREIVPPVSGVDDEETILKQNETRLNDGLNNVPRSFGYMIELFLEQEILDGTRFKLISRMNAKSVNDRLANHRIPKEWEDFQTALKTIRSSISDNKGGYQEYPTLLKYARLYRDLVSYYVENVKYPPGAPENEDAGPYFYYSRTWDKKRYDALQEYLNGMKKFYDNLVGIKKLKGLLQNAHVDKLGYYLQQLRCDRVKALVKEEHLLGSDRSAILIPWQLTTKGTKGMTNEDARDIFQRMIGSLWVSLEQQSLQVFSSISLDHFPKSVLKFDAFTHEFLPELFSCNFVRSEVVDIVFDEECFLKLFAALQGKVMKRYVVKIRLLEVTPPLPKTKTHWFVKMSVCRVTDGAEGRIEVDPGKGPGDRLVVPRIFAKCMVPALHMYKRSELAGDSIPSEGMFSDLLGSLIRPGSGSSKKKIHRCIDGATKSALLELTGNDGSTSVDFCALLEAIAERMKKFRKGEYDHYKQTAGDSHNHCLFIGTAKRILGQNNGNDGDRTFEILGDKKDLAVFEDQLMTDFGGCFFNEIAILFDNEDQAKAALSDQLFEQTLPKLVEYSFWPVCGRLYAVFTEELVKGYQKHHAIMEKHKISLKRLPVGVKPPNASMSLPDEEHEQKWLVFSNQDENDTFIGLDLDSSVGTEESVGEESTGTEESVGEESTTKSFKSKTVDQQNQSRRKPKIIIWRNKTNDDLGEVPCIVLGNFPVKYPRFVIGQSVKYETDTPGEPSHRGTVKGYKTNVQRHPGYVILKTDSSDSVENWRPYEAVFPESPSHKMGLSAAISKFHVKIELQGPQPRRRNEKRKCRKSEKSSGLSE